MSTENALAQANAQLTSIVEMVEVLNVDYYRLEELADSIEEDAHIANWSMVGCLPDNDAMQYDSEDDARLAIVEELRERAENALESMEYNQDDEFFCNELKVYAEKYNEAADHFEQSKDTSIVVNGWYFWISPDEYKGLDSDDWQEYQELKAKAGECTSEDDARQRIVEDALSIEMRSDWEAVGSDDNKPTEFRIVLCTGGPHVEIQGELSEHGEPIRAWLVYQDWFTGKIERVNNRGDQDALLAYASCFYFGE